MAIESQSLGFGRQPALLVVDASLGFTDPASPLGADFSAAIGQIARLLDAVHRVHWPVWFSTVVYRRPEEARVFREKLPGLNALTPDSPWIHIDPRLRIGPEDHLIEKLHASCFHGTGLQQALSDRGVDTLLVTGFTTSGCVRASVVDALQYGYRTLVVSDAVADRDASAHSANLKDMGLKYADLISTEAAMAHCIPWQSTE